MLKKKSKNIVYNTTILTFFLICCFLIYNSEKDNIEIEIKNKVKTYYIHKDTNKIEDKNINYPTEESNTIYDNDIIGKLIIKKLDIENNLYEIHCEKNKVDKNVTILNGSIEPTNKDSIMFLAAHSGTGKFAYFKNLDKLKEDDEVILIYKGQKYYYYVKNIWETSKDGSIEVTKLVEKQLILTTCSPSHKDKQLIINCTIKES